MYFWVGIDMFGVFGDHTNMAHFLCLTICDLGCYFTTTLSSLVDLLASSKDHSVQMESGNDELSKILDCWRTFHIVHSRRAWLILDLHPMAISSWIPIKIAHLV